MNIEKLKAAYEAATPGKWAVDTDDFEMISAEDDAVCVVFDKGDRDFITLAHEMMPLLLKTAEQLIIAFNSPAFHEKRFDNENFNNLFMTLHELNPVKFHGKSNEQ